MLVNSLAIVPVHQSCPPQEPRVLILFGVDLNVLQPNCEDKPHDLSLRDT